MERDEIIEEISRRKGIAMEEVAEILEEEDAIYDEECEKYVRAMKKKKRKKKMYACGTAFVFLAGAACALFVLDRKNKISIDEIEDLVKDNVKQYTDKYMESARQYADSVKQYADNVRQHTDKYMDRMKKFNRTKE